MSSGIYRILCKETEQFYLGSSKNIEKRFEQHISKLRCKKHYNKIVQATFDEYGEKSFICEIVEIVERTKLIEKENEYLRKNWKNEKSMNVVPKAYPPSPTIDQTAERIRNTMRGTRIGSNNPNFGKLGKKRTLLTRYRMALKKIGTKWCVDPDGKECRVQSDFILPKDWRWGRNSKTWKESENG